jgi:peptide-methionine (S)-S-oxide reductase
LTRIGLGGGCHWCTEAVFQSLRGVGRVEQGFIRSAPPHDAWSEAVIAHFDPCRIDLEMLIEVHVRTHAATRQHNLREKYRSAVYTFDDQQAKAAKEALERMQGSFDEQLITKVLPFAAFRLSAPRFQNYYRTDPHRPFCQRFIDPKLALIRRQFSHGIEE